MAVCKIHGLEFDKSSWVCPVCDSDRCSRCEYIICGVDGRKKDRACSFNCKFCQSRVGNDHQVICDSCGAKGCRECIRTGAIEGKKLCPDCGMICSECKKTYSREYLSRCSACPAQICSICGIRTCSRCAAQVCHQHSFKCADCGEFYCKECLGGIDSSGEAMFCQECAYVCPTCHTTLSKKNARTCEECGAQMCINCVRTCVKCRKTYCKKHISRCSICKENVCNEHTDICPACGGHTCKVHFFTCRICGVSYCERCRPQKSKLICNLCDNIKPLKEKHAQKFLEKLKEKTETLKGFSDWEYSEGRKVYLFYGKSLLGSVVAVADKTSRELLKVNKLSPLDKIRAFFSSYIGK